MICLLGSDITEIVSVAERIEISKPVVNSDKPIYLEDHRLSYPVHSALNDPEIDDHTFRRFSEVGIGLTATALFLKDPVLSSFLLGMSSILAVELVKSTSLYEYGVRPMARKIRSHFR